MVSSTDTNLVPLDGNIIAIQPSKTIPEFTFSATVALGISVGHCYL
jgi:hypothetical protein